MTIMKRIISYLCTMAILLAMGTAAYADEVNSPSVSFITTTNEDGTYTVTLNWEKTTLQAFEYSVVYDEDKVSVQSAKLTGQFLSPYLGDGKNYSGIAIANDNGGYVALGGVVEAQDPTKIPQYEGAIARIVFAPKNTNPPATEDGDGNATAAPVDNNNQNVDMGDIKVVEGVSQYGSVEEIRQKADSEPMTSFNLVQSAGGEPIAANAAGTATGTNSDDNAQSQDNPIEEPSMTQSAEGTGESVDISGSGAVATKEEESTPESLATDKTSAPTKATQEPKEKEDSKGSNVAVIVVVVGCIAVAVVAVIYFKKKQDADKPEEPTGNAGDSDNG